MDITCKKFLLVALFATLPCDSFLIKLLEDDRFFKLSGRLYEQVMADGEARRTLPLEVWDIFAAGICSADDQYIGAQLRAESLEAMYASISYSDRNAFFLHATLALAHRLWRRGRAFA